MDNILYPEIEPFDLGFLAVTDGHLIYWERSGNPQGKPVVVLHGGPGGASDPLYRRFFDPSRYQIIMFDQRGCGQSTPHAGLEGNHTLALVDDIERLRKSFGIDRWQVFGGSWGSTLALVYAENHPDRVTELVLRGIFMASRSELQWFYQEGTSRLFPDTFEPYRNHIPESERGDLISAYYRRLTSSDESTRLAAARQWALWELSTCTLVQNKEAMAKAQDDHFSLAFARIEAHFFFNGIFLDDDYILKHIAAIHEIPGAIIHGRYDVICPAENAWRLHKAWPKSELFIVQDAGHSITEVGIAEALVATTNRFA